MDAADTALMQLPGGAALPVVRMALLGGRDLVACRVAQTGWQSFERPLPEVFFRVASRWPGLVLDVGANTGFYTMLAAAAHAANSVVACEPLPEILHALHLNLCANGLRDRARLIRCAVGARNGSAELYLPQQANDVIETSASMRRDFKAAHAGSVAVLQRTLDRIVLRPSLIRRRVTIVKIDVEGCEAQVLSGAGWMTGWWRPFVFLEILPRADFGALARFLRRHGYVDMVLPAAGAPFVASEVAFHADAWNHAFVPREKAAAFVTALSGLWP